MPRNDFGFARTEKDTMVCLRKVEAAGSFDGEDTLLKLIEMYVYGQYAASASVLNRL